jgi:hypothetical protein
MLTAGRALFGEKPDPRSNLYWLDIDVNILEIIRPQRMISSNLTVQRSPWQYSVLQGVGTAANALSVGETGATFHNFEVDVAALVRSDGDIVLPERHRSARMIWNEGDVHSPRLEIYVQTRTLRHLVELSITKRIDTVVMSMKIEVDRRDAVAELSSSDLFPILDKHEHLYFRRTQCELLSVHVSLARERTGKLS